MSNQNPDPDRCRKDDPAYWAAALVLAIKNGNSVGEKSARRNLRRLRFDLVRVEKRPSKIEGGDA